MAKQPSTISFDASCHAFACSGCGQKVPISRFTLKSQDRYIETLERMQDKHRDCSGKSPAEARMNRLWREGMMREAGSLA